MECETTESLIRNAAAMKLNELADHIDFLAMKIETVKLGFETANIGLKTLCNKEAIKEPEAVQAAVLMLPAPKKLGGKNKLCPVCKKWCKKGEEIHEKCREIRESKLPTCHGGVKRD